MHYTFYLKPTTAVIHFGYVHIQRHRHVRQADMHHVPPSALNVVGHVLSTASATPGYACGGLRHWFTLPLCGFLTLASPVQRHFGSRRPAWGQTVLRRRCRRPWTRPLGWGEKTQSAGPRHCRLGVCPASVASSGRRLF